MTARRLLLTAAELELLRRRTSSSLVLPPGFVGEDLAVEEAAPALVERGLLSPGGEPHPALAADLRLLAAPEVSVHLRAARPGLAVEAVLAVGGDRGAGLLRTGGEVVQLSAFRPGTLGAELARVVPAPAGAHPLRAEVVAPLADLLDDRPGGRLRALHRGWTGALHAVVVGRRPQLPVEWGWLADGPAGGWVGLEPVGTRPSPQVRVVPVVPADLGSWLAPRVAQALAEQAPAA